MNQALGIQAMVEPTPDDFRRAIVTQVHHAREMLWLAERQAQDILPNAGPALVQIGAAHKALAAARSLLHEADAGPSATRLDTLLRRAEHAVEAAEGHVRRYASYAASCGTKLEQDQLKKLRPIWRRAAEEAKKDAHRALVFLCERFPDSYEREDVS